MITSIEKDQVLSFICENCPLSALLDIPYSEFKLFGMEPEDIRAIFSHFKRKGLISHYSERRHSVQFVLLVEANDYLLHGGFLAQE